jgi:tetratricopeptide (TPR) repeat protein
METREFGTRLRELRKQVGLSQRELADKTGVHFSYLSKIESGVMPPPSTQVILRLAEVLNADKDELMLLAGKVPSDIAQILKNRQTLQMLRASHAQEKTKTKKEGIGIMRNMVNYRRLSKIAVPVILVCAVAASVWFASPVVDTAAAFNEQGVFYNNKGEYQKATAAFTKAIELDPSLVITYSNRGWVYIQLGQYEEAIADCTKAIELDPSLAFAYNCRGWAYTELRQYEEAIDDFNKAIELDPSLQK